MSVFYAPLANTISDKAVTQPLPTVSLPSRFPPPRWGPRWNAPPQDPTVMHLELFNPPVYQPDPRRVPVSTVNAQGTGNIPASCPVAPILLRNHWETYNVTSGKVFGGFDQYNLQNIPSCTERSGNYMNFVDSTRPWSRVLVTPAEDQWAVDSHGGKYAEPIPRWQEARLNS